MKVFALVPVVSVHDGKATMPASPGWEPETVPTSPAAAARAWYEQGARRIQVVDAQVVDGVSPNSAAITRLVHELHGQAWVDLVSGVHDDVSLRAALHIGPTQVVLSAAAVADQDFVRRAIEHHGDRITVRLVIGNGGLIHAPGTEADGLHVLDVLGQLEALGAQRYLVNDATRQGHWWQSHQDVLAEFVRVTDRPVTAGSGVDSLEHLHELCDLVPFGLDSAVIGHALDAGVFTFADALAAIAARYDPYEWGPAQP
ncbi:MAG: HisA/HisF-related TIM barrel protein [Actinomycetes bacterium]